MARIAVGGWHHETNTFAPIKADFAAFERADGWPPLRRGEKMFEAVDGVHLPVTGAITQLRELGHELAPLLWCSATPCAQVTEHAFDTIVAMLLEKLEAALPVDGVYLDLHGAMVCEHLQDGEGEILSRVRELVGPDMPIAVSLDLHANVTRRMVDEATVLDIYRTYPHIDMGETGARTARHLHRLLGEGALWHKAHRQTAFLIPINWGCTLIEPAKSLYQALPGLIDGDVLALSFACGFPLSDIADVGPTVIAYARTPEAAQRAADSMLNAVNRNEDRFGGRIWEVSDGLREALRVLETQGGPVILADTQDNPGGGGPGDTTGVLKALVENHANGAVFGMLTDSVAAARAHDCGVGGNFAIALGEHSKMAGHKPYHAEFRVLYLGDGSFTATGPMYKGAHMKLGPCALLETQGVRVMVCSKAVQTADQSIFRHLGIEPAEEKIIALKSSVHFRNDFQDIASEILIVAAPGPVYADPSTLRFSNIRSGVRLTPRR